jgi:RNA polymerase sigma-70 factor, ECF subfamily
VRQLEVGYTGLTDEELARRAKSGSEASFEELVRRFQAPLLRLLLRKTPNRADAEDLLQETFLRAFERLHQYSEQWPFRSWIFTIAHRLAISRHRAAAPPAGGEMLLEGVGSNETAPLDTVDQAEQGGRLWSAAHAALTSEQFTALWLFYAEDMPAAEIARVLDRSWVSVKTMLHRARRALLPLLAECYDECR